MRSYYFHGIFDLRGELRWTADAADGVGDHDVLTLEGIKG
jgi:hypothetical protein